MKRSLWAVCALLCAAAALAAPPGQKKPKDKRPKTIAMAVSARPRPENQLVTVDEFIKRRFKAQTLVSIEGYIVMGYRRADRSVQLMLTDSVDHVLSAQDAEKLMVGSALCVVPAATVARKPILDATGRGMFRFTMYTGAGHAQRKLNDVIAKLRVTGVAMRSTLSPVTRVEFMDDNGDWKGL